MRDLAFNAAALIFVVLMIIAAANAAGGFEEDHQTETLTNLEQTAQAFWSQRDVTLPTPVELFRIPNTPDAVAYGDLNGKRVWLTAHLFKPRAAYVRCLVYLHERGHNAGLGHDAPLTIMHAEIDGSMRVPKCLRFSRSEGIID
jgi:hypothetical protein